MSDDGNGTGNDTGNDTGGGGTSSNNEGGRPGGWGGGWGNNDDHHYDDNRYDDYNNDGRKYSDLPFCFQIVPPACFMVIGLIVGIATLARGIDVQGSYDEVVGKIISIQSCGCSSTDGGRCTTTYQPVVEYFVDGQRYEFTISTCSSPPPKVGNDINVRYDPDEPNEAVSGSFVALWLAPIIGLTIGIIGCLCICGLSYKKCMNKPETSNNFQGGNNAESSNPASQMVSNPYTTSSNPPPASNPYTTSSNPPPASNPYTTQTTTTTTSGGGTSLFDQLSSKK